MVLFPNHWSQTVGSPNRKSFWSERVFVSESSVVDEKMTLAVHLNLTRRRFLNLEHLVAEARQKKSIRYVTLHLIEGDTCAQLRSVTEIASKSPFDM